MIARAWKSRARVARTQFSKGSPTMRATSRLRELLEMGDIVVAPGVFDGLSAKLVERAGFAAVYASGGTIARRTGVPDLGLLSAAEMTARIAEIAGADTGYGNALNVQRTVRQYARRRRSPSSSTCSRAARRRSSRS